MNDDLRRLYRRFLKDTIRKSIDFSQTDQSRGMPPPPMAKPPAPDALIIDLVKPHSWQGIRRIDLTEAIGKRRSHRVYLPAALTLDELSFLLWATQGIRRKADRGHAYRTVPSAGCRHALETYLAVLNVQGLETAIYRYLPLEHQIVLVHDGAPLAERIVAAAFGQPYPGQAAATFIWTAVPYRMEWRYGPASGKAIALDAGHVGQNLYLACAAVGAGTCAIAAYDQEAMDRLLGVDGDEEFAIYLASVGKIKR
ncbi:MAG: SagB/ThcOx family dehydrogenase [Pseudomonadota bacterium]|nr:SagB/ThcOx family dehydrogenase [Pseudomonadota bacterium]